MATINATRPVVRDLISPNIPVNTPDASVVAVPETFAGGVAVRFCANTAVPAWLRQPAQVSRPEMALPSGRHTSGSSISPDISRM